MPQKPQDVTTRPSKRKLSKPQHIYQPPSMVPLHSQTENDIHNQNIDQMMCNNNSQSETWAEIRQESSQSNLPSIVQNKFVNKRKRTIPLPKNKSKIMRLFSRGEFDGPQERMTAPFMYGGQMDRFTGEKDSLTMEEIQRAIAATSSVSFSRSLEHLAKQRTNMELQTDIGSSKQQLGKNQPLALNQMKDIVGINEVNLSLPFNHERGRKFDQSTESLQRQLTNGQHRDINLLSQHVF